MRSVALSRRISLALLAVLLCLTTLSGQGLAHTPVATPVAPISVLDLADMDMSTPPGRDFDRFVNGGWIDTTEIPDDWPSYGVLHELTDRTNVQLIALLQGVQPNIESPSDQDKAAILFQQGTDLEARNAQGIAPLMPIIARYDAVTSLDELHALWTDPAMTSLADLFNFDVIPDPADSTMNVLWLSGPSLGLPDVTYYTDNAEENADVIASYQALLAGMLEATGTDPAVSESAAMAIFAFETAMAGHMVTEEEAQDFAVIYNPATIEELAAFYPGLDWPAYYAALGIQGTPIAINTELELMTNLDAIITGTDLQTIKDYLKTRAVFGSYDMLSEDLQALVFPFIQALYGVESQSSTEHEVLGVVNAAFGDAVGQLYVAEYFSPEAKAEVTEMVENLIAAFGERIAGLTWMSDATKATAQEKLQAMGLLLGYPDTWQSYAGVEIGTSYFETATNSFRAGYRDLMATAGQPVDRSQWYMNAQEVNAYYDPLTNQIAFPAAILQPPLFDVDADDAWNYGATGSTIGHEITHGFDLSGSQFDAQGNYVSWWTEEDLAAFTALNDRVAAQYSEVEVLPDLFLDGELTVTENVADMGGVQAAWDAFQARPGYGSEAEIDGFTPDERFFIAYTTSSRGIEREEYLRTSIVTDVHAPWSVRAVVPIQNMDAFHETFGIGPGDPMYLAPEDRIVVW